MRTRAEQSEVLKEIDLFSDFNRKELATLAECLRPEVYEDGEDIVREGERDGRFFIIVSGTAVARVGGKKLATMGPRQYFGEIALIDRGPRTATVTAVGPVVTLSAASFTFRPILKEHPDLQYKLMIKLCEKVRVADRRLVG
jgi:CRP-like cAMP-binding protein